MKKILQRLDAFWFIPLAPERLALLRIAGGAFVLWYLTNRLDLFSTLSQSDISMFAPVGAVWWLGSPLPDDLIRGFLYLTLSLNLAYLVGWKFRWTGPLFALSLLFLFSYRYSWSMIYHDMNALVLQVLVIGFVASADACSVDAWQYWRRHPEVASLGAHWRYGWPVRLVCTVTALTYLLSGIAKIKGELAWDWISGEALRSQVAIDALRKEMLGGSASPLFEWMYSHSEVFLVLGGGTLLLELGAPVALLHRRAGIIWSLLTWAMHWGIFFMMGILFRFQMSGMVFLPFFEVEKWWAHLRKQVFQPPAT